MAKGKVSKKSININEINYPEFQELKGKIDWLLTAMDKSLLFHFLDLEIKRISHKTFGEFDVYKKFAGHQIRERFRKDMTILSKNYIKGKYLDGKDN